MADEPTRADLGLDQDPAPYADDAGPATRRTPSSRLPAIAIALATFAAGGALGLVARNVLDRQEHTLLKERTNEVSTILSTAINDARTNLRGAGAARTWRAEPPRARARPAPAPPRASRPPGRP